MSELKYWVWLSALALRPRTRLLLLERLGGPREVYFSRREDCEALGGLTPAELEALDGRQLDGARRVLETCAEREIGVVTLGDAAYPRRLAALYDPPAVLYVRGRLPEVDEEAAVAVIGTRRATPYGMKMALRMGYELTKCGGLVVSGLTRGVDGEAARGALRAGGGCLGVLPCAIDADWGGPLARDVAVVGALVSEYPPGTPDTRHAYRLRNRITAGLAVATLVVEAPERSGALLFADEAVSQGKEVFVVPANADSPLAAGSNALLRDGALPAMRGWDVLEGFAARFPGRLRGPDAGPPLPEDAAAAPPEGPAPARETGEGFALLREPGRKKVVDKPESVAYIDLKKQLEGLTEAQLAIVAAIEAPGTHVDDIIARCGLPPAQVLAELTLLQISGCVRQEPGKRFSLNVRRN